jgi:iron complex outermembrane recepter protein
MSDGQHHLTSRRRVSAGSFILASLLFCSRPGFAQQQASAQELKRLTLEQLAKIEVTLVSRQPEPIGHAAAAISVITRDDIRRAGVTTIPDAIGLADGVHVARFNNGTWAITARGFNANTANKLQVMVDGRSEFTPLFAGVFWNVLDYVLEDIDRIEVIRGPGATLWGANAVNGVINIVTRHSRDTRGTFVSMGTGNEDPMLVDVRYGAGSGDKSYRVYGKFAQRDQQQFSTGTPANDTRRRLQAGFRIDTADGANRWMLKGDAFHSRDDFVDRRDGEWTEMAVQGRYSRELARGSELQLHSYYRREYRNIERQLTHTLDTFDVDLQHALRIGQRNHFIWGSAFRVNQDNTEGSTVLHFDPPDRTHRLLSAFAQNEFAIRPNQVSVTAGIKVEHNSFSGADWQPNLRARWLISPDQALWAAVARAVRRPTRFEDDIVVTSPTGLVLVRGTDTFRSEEMTGWEVGYRARPFGPMSVDATVFTQDYDRLRSQEAPLTGIVPVTVGNTLEGRSRGIELGVTVQPDPLWRLHTSYTRLDTKITRAQGSRDVSGGVNETNDPRHLFSFRTAVDLPRNVEIDAWVRAIGALPNPHVPAYTELNGRIGWRPSARLELALIGQDLLHAQHPEFGTPVPRRIEFERSVRVLLTLRSQ